MKIRRSGLLAVLLVAWLTGAVGQAAEQKVLFQTSTIQALLNGVYDGDFSFEALKKHGDFGQGTFEALDGEMVAVDGRFYQVKSDGQVYPVAPTQKTPFAEVTCFRTDKTLDATEIPDLRHLEQYLTEQLPSPNVLYAFKITGKFAYIKTRSVPRQVKPYPPLAEAAKHQKVFEFRNVDGVMVGFFHPRFLAGVNVAGYHFHFLSADRRAGGHLLDCRFQQARVEWSRINNFQLRLPGTEEFSRTDLSGDQQQEIDRVER